MKAIKKVKISNIPKTEGAVVDSVSSNVDQTTNAPSIRAILQKIQEVASNIVHAITADRLKTARKISIKGAVSGAATFDGSKDVTITTTQANIAVIEGSFVLKDGNTDTIDGISETTTHIDFPVGFNKNNCFLLSFGTKILEADMGYGYGSTATYEIFDYQENYTPARILLGDENGKIVITADNMYHELTLKYQIVLMKKNTSTKEIN